MPKAVTASAAFTDDTEWLHRVREVRHPIDLIHPLRVHNGWQLGTTGHGQNNHTPRPESHPYCEFSFVFAGRYIQYIGTEKMERSPGEMLLVGPGIPHYAKHLKFPIHVIAVHFLPVLLFELSPSDGARILNRFTGSRSISQRIVRLPKAIRAGFAAQFEKMAQESEHPQLGSDMYVRSILMDILVKLLRWEESAGIAISPGPSSSNWIKVEKILHFIYQHYTENIYVEQIAREAGLSIGNLHKLFREAFDMSCTQYLRAYRISHAASLLSQPGARVTEVAATVGFETLSHFNASFHRFKGMSPREYIRSQKSPA